MQQIRWHGRGGQGAVTAARIFGMAACLKQNYYAQAFPAFGVERRGAPVQAFTKIDQNPILDRSQIYQPDYVVVLDSGLLQTVDVTMGLREGGKVILNWEERDEYPPIASKFECKTINASRLAFEVLGRPITNTAMVGALCAVLEEISLESVQEAIREVLPAHLVAKNIRVVEQAYYQVKGRETSAKLVGR